MGDAAGAHPPKLIPRPPALTPLQETEEYWALVKWLRHGSSIGGGGQPDWWPCLDAALALGCPPWELSGEPMPCRYYWYARVLLRKLAVAEAAKKPESA